jgi:hypothetical protein
MSEVERELHAEFFTRWSDDERLLIKDMTDEQLTAHRNELARIALESKVRTTTADEEIRQRRAKKSGNETRQWLVPTDVEDTVKQVRERRERMTKLDKINEALLNLMSEEDAAQLMNGNIKKVGDARLGVIKIVKSDVKQSEGLKNDEPFDFSKLGD